MSKSEKGILVLGTGELGDAVLQELVPQAQARGLTVDVLVRSRSSDGAAFARSLGLSIVEADVAHNSEDKLAIIFQKYDTVLSCVGFAAGPGTQLKLTRAVLSAGTRRYFPWQFGVDYDVLGYGSSQPVFDEQLNVRGLLRTQAKTHWVIVSVGMFTSFLFEPSFGIVNLQEARVHALGSWENAVTVTTPEDIGKLTTEILLAEPEFTDTVVYVAGDTITYGQLADTVQKALGKSVQREVWTVDELEKEVRQNPEDTLKRYRAVFAAGKGISWPKEGTYNAVHSIPVTDTEAWLKSHLASRST